jgi:hypothetical protein
VAASLFFAPPFRKAVRCKKMPKAEGLGSFCLGCGKGCFAFFCSAFGGAKKWAEASPQPSAEALPRRNPPLRGAKKSGAKDKFGKLKE